MAKQSAAKSSVEHIKSKFRSKSNVKGKNSSPVQPYNECNDLLYNCDASHTVITTFSYSGRDVTTYSYNSAVQFQRIVLYIPRTY